MTSRPPSRRLRRGLTPRHYLHVVRHRMVPGQGDPVVHDHEFVEVFWVEAGTGIHLEGDREAPLEAGDCLFIRAEDRHGFLNGGEDDLAWTNVTLDRDTERRLRERYATELGWWPWRPGGPIRRYRLTPAQREELGERAAALPADAQRTVDLDWFITALLRALRPVYGLSQRSHPPAWLADAVRRMTREEHLAEGLAAFRRLAGRSGEHLNRRVREHYGTTARDLVCQLRLERAARLLRLSDRDILELSLACGFENLSYFYRRFRERFGTTPRAYRKGPG